VSAVVTGDAVRVGLLRRLDDQVIGKAERDPAARRRADVWANGLLLLIGAGLAIALYLSDNRSAERSPVVYVLIGIVAGGALLRIARTRRVVAMTA
jgi:hypothetical protein